MIIVYTAAAEWPRVVAMIAHEEIEKAGPGYYVHSVVVSGRQHHEIGLGESIARSLEPEIWGLSTFNDKAYIVNFRLESERPR